VTAAPEVGEVPVGESDDGALEAGRLSTAALSAVAAVDASVADNTRTAYTSDWARFEAWCTAEGRN